MRPAPSAVRRWLRRRLRTLQVRLRPRTMPRQALLLLWLTALTVLVAVLGVFVPEWLPPSSMVLVLLLGGFLLRMRAMVLLYLVAAAGLAFTAVFRSPEAAAPPGGYLVVAVTALKLMVFVRSRERLGVQGTLGDTMLVDLRDRLRAQGRVPPLPEQWHVETVLRPAFGDSFSGDFVVAVRSASGRRLELVLVDVSGKGQSAGTRALLLSGAFGGLLGAMPAEEFLPAANTYLLRQDWPEGFATAVHLALDLAQGHYRISYAGHPPAATSRRGEPWRLVEGEAGPALGLVPDADFPAVRGRLEPGEGLFVYTDGMVEVPGEDLAVGTQALLDLAGQVCAAGCQEGDAERLVEGAQVAEADDRALVLLWRDA
jgi:hypothetical protein